MQERGSPGVAPRRAPRAAALARLAVRLLLVGVLVAAVAQVTASATFRVPRGSVTFGLEPAWPGGRLVMPLGPAGEYALRTHHTPVDIVMEYRLAADTAALTSADGLLGRLPALEAGARTAFTRYVLGKIPWLLLAGAAAGALVAGPRLSRRRSLGAACLGLVGAALLGGAFGLATYATLDRSPAVEYRGPALAYRWANPSEAAARLGSCRGAAQRR